MPKRLTSTLYRSAVLLLTLFLFSQCGTRKATPRRPRIELPECSISDVAYSVPQLPGAEMRAVWLTTIFGLDWPKVSADTYPGMVRQQESLDKMLDAFVQAGINTVFLQVRLRGDLLYPSSLEPLSPTVSKTGALPSGYDPLQYAIDACHSRGMSVHAWMVVYPLGTNDHVRSLAKQGKGFYAAHPEMCLRQGNAWFMDPAQPAVRTHMAQLVRDLVTRYDVDGVHLDYIRYPDGPNKFNDLKSYQRMNPQRLPRMEWREANVTAMIDTLHRTLQEVAPEVALSTACIGKYQQLPKPAPGGYFCKNDVSQDPLVWFQRGIVDFIVPMIYYKDAHFNYYIADWAKRIAPHGPIVAGLGVYRLYDNSRWQLQDIYNQLDTVAHYGLPGVSYYRAEQFLQMYDQLPAERQDQLLLPTRRPAFGAGPRIPFGMAKVEEIIDQGEHLTISWGYDLQEPTGHTFNLYYRLYGSHLDCPLVLLGQSLAGRSATISRDFLPEDVLVEFFIEPTTFSGHTGQLSAGALYYNSHELKK